MQALEGKISEFLFNLDIKKGFPSMTLLCNNSGDI